MDWTQEKKREKNCINYWLMKWSAVHQTGWLTLFGLFGCLHSSSLVVVVFHQTTNKILITNYPLGVRDRHTARCIPSDRSETISNVGIFRIAALTDFDNSRYVRSNGDARVSQTHIAKSFWSERGAAHSTEPKTMPARNGDENSIRPNQICELVI